MASRKGSGSVDRKQALGVRTLGFEVAVRYFGAVLETGLRSRPPPRSTAQLPSLDSQVWMAAEVHWLLWAYLLEFRQLPVRPAVWVASCLFLLAHINVLCEVRRGTGPKAHAA